MKNNFCGKISKHLSVDLFTAHHDRDLQQPHQLFQVSMMKEHQHHQHHLRSETKKKNKTLECKQKGIKNKSYLGIFINTKSLTKK